jgi:hypothetical protein
MYAPHYSADPVIGRRCAPTRWLANDDHVPGGGAKKQRRVPSGRLQRQ